MAQISRLFVDYVGRYLVEYVYDAVAAGLDYGFGRTYGSLQLSFYGYNDKLSLFIRGVLERIKGMETVQKEFDILKQDVSCCFPSSASDIDGV